MEDLKRRFPDLEFFPLRKPEDFAPARHTLPLGHRKTPPQRPFSVDTIFDRDVQVQLRDGTKIYTDVFRPATSEHGSSVPGIIAWSPYGKANPLQTYEHMGPFACGLQPGDTSGYNKFEGPDPADWCGRGYAIINPDARGAGFSEGNIALWGEQEAHDFHDLIDWVSKQPWCNGNVATAGNSWLAISQINVAARNPHPALKAIAPWEAATDGYKDFMARGGIPRGGFMPMLYQTMTGMHGAEDGSAMAKKRPLLDEYWATKVIPVDKIKVPMYLTASYSTLLHSRGSFETFEKSVLSERWLRVHHTQEWYDLYQRAHVDELQAFFDKYCKGMNTGWEETPRLRLSLLAFDRSIAKTIIEKEAPSFPLPATEYRKFFLDSTSNTLTAQPPAVSAKCSYESHHLTDSANFSFYFDDYTELAGYPYVKLFISCDDHDDMDIHIQIRKIGIDGTLLTSLNYPVPVPGEQVDDTNVAKFLGCDGMLRASHRVSRIKSGHDYPVYGHDKAEKVDAGSIIELDIPLWPIGMVFERGEGMMLRVAGHELRLPELKVLERSSPTDENVGKHWIHTGGGFSGYLSAPVVKSWS